MALLESVSLLCRIYFGGKQKISDDSPYTEGYAIEREIRRLTEPAQMECERVPTYLPLLITLCREYLDGTSTLSDFTKKLSEVNRLKHAPVTVSWHLIKPLTIYGATDYTFYVDFYNDGLDYIVERLAYYTGCPPESIELLSAGVVYTGPFSKYAFYESDLSYCILPYTPPRLDLSGNVSDTMYGFNGGHID